MATTVTVQIVLKGRSTVGSSVNTLDGELLCVKVFGVAAGHSSVNALPVALTLSVNVIEILESAGTFVAPFTGEVLSTEGAVSPAPKFCPVLGAFCVCAIGPAHVKLP